MLLGIVATGTALASNSTSFIMNRSGAAKTAQCLRGAKAEVQITTLGPVELLDVKVHKLLPNTEYDLFVIQLPNPPFGVSWYQGDVETDNLGEGHSQFLGRFSIETFAVAPGVGPAPVVHDQLPFKDASQNPQFAPIHTFHLGLWFNNPQDAKQAGCPDTVTPFNGDHNAGIQILSTRRFPDTAGPLSQVKP